MVGTFKKNIPYNNFLLFIYGLFLKWPIFFHTTVPSPKSNDTFFYKSILLGLQHLSFGFPFVYGLITYLIIYLQAILLNKIVNDQKLFSRPHYLVGMSYLLFTSVFNNWFVITPILLSTLLMIWILSSLCKLFNIQDPKKMLFNIGLVLGIACLIYPPLIIFLVLVLIALTITRPFRLPEWIIVIVGLMTPVYFLLAYLFLFKGSLKEAVPATFMKVPHFSLIPIEWVAIGLILLTIIIGFVFIQNNISRLLVHSRRSWIIIFLYFFSSILLLFVNEHSDFQYALMFISGASLIASAAFYYPNRKWFSLILHWGMVIIASLNGYYFILH